MFVAWGTFVFQHRRAVLGASAIVLALGLFGLTRPGALTTGAVEGVEAEKAQRLAETSLGLPGATSFELIFHHDAWTFDDPRFQQAMIGALLPLQKDARVAGVESAITGSALSKARYVSDDKHAAVAIVTLKGSIKSSQNIYRELRDSIDPGPLTVKATGQLAFLRDLDRMLAVDLRKAEMVSMPLALLVLIWVFGSVVAAGLPLGVGALAVVCGVSAVLALSHAVDMAQYTLNVVSLVGLGVAIDYSLFIVSRMRDELNAGVPVKEALERTLDTAGRAVAFSGIAVMVGLSGLLFFGGSYLQSMGLAGAVVVALAVLFALTFLPALLAVLGPNLNRLRVRRRMAGASGRWHVMALWVMRHPVLVLVPTLAVLVLLGAPFFRLKLANADVTVLPESSEARQGYEALQREFPKLAANRILVVVEYPNPPALTPERIGALYDASRAFAKLPGVASVESIVDLSSSLDKALYQQIATMPPEFRPPELDEAIHAFMGDRAALMWVLTKEGETSASAAQVVRDLRQTRMVGDGRMLVGGPTAHDLDATEFIRARTPAAVGFVVTMTFLVLFLLLGSVVLPLKAVLMNLLSLTASFGAMVWIFQDGHLAGLLHFHPRPLEPALPVLLFCFVFGLSMDYEVLLLSRMQEEWLRTRDNTRAVAQGLEKSAGLITSAAAIMVAVFAAFGIATIVVVKAMGIGLALAVALDATLVRTLVVPATMRLFGDLNWWAPAPLARRFAAHRVPRGPVAHGRP